MPIGAATNVTESAIPTIIKINPLMPATTRPVNLMKKLNNDQTITNGSNTIGVFLPWKSIAVSFLRAGKCTDNFDGVQRKSGVPECIGTLRLRTNPEVGFVSSSAS